VDFLACWDARSVFSLHLLVYLEAVCSTCRELLSSGFYKTGTCWLTLLPSPIYTWHPQMHRERESQGEQTNEAVLP